MTDLPKNGNTPETDQPDKGGRPKGTVEYTPALRDEICLRLASGRTLRSVCRDEDMPDRQTIYNWLYVNIGEVKDGERVVEPGFFDHYTRAREVGLDEVADETMEIADDGTNDFVEIETKRSGKKVIFDKETVMRSTLRVNNRWKYLENMAPRKYGKNVTVKSQQLDDQGNPTSPANAAQEFLDLIEQTLDKELAKGKTPAAAPAAPVKAPAGSWGEKPKA